jgi:hypothetical protein
MFVVFYIFRNYILPELFTFNIALNDMIFQVSIPRELSAGFLAVGVRLALKGFIEDIIETLLPTQKQTESGFVALMKSRKRPTFKFVFCFWFRYSF